MATKPLKNPGVTGGSTRRSPLAPTGGGQSGLPLEDWDPSQMRGELRPRLAGGATGAGDATALGMKGTRGRTATNAAAQFRITAKMPGPTSPEAQQTLANGKVMPAVMGSRQNFYAAGQYGPLG